MSLFTLFPAFLPLPFCPSLSFLCFCAFFFSSFLRVSPGLLGAQQSLQPSTPMPTITHFFFFLSGDIYLFLPCLLPAHSSQSLSPDISSHSLSSFTPRPLSNFPALGPIHLPICVPASLDHDIAHSVSLLIFILPSPYTTSTTSPPLSFIHSFVYSFACKSNYEKQAYGANLG